MGRTAPTPFYVSVGQRIRAARLNTGFSQNDLAECIGAKSGHGTMSEIESGRRHIALHTLYAIADALGVSIECLLPEREFPHA